MQKDGGGGGKAKFFPFYEFNDISKELWDFDRNKFLL